MLDFVVDGFYKSMSSFIYKAIRNTGKFILYEPLTPNALDDQKRGTYSPLHGFDVWDTYFEQRFLPYYPKYVAIHKKLQVRVGGDITALKLDQVREFFDFIHDLPFECSVQPNNCHFILKELSDDYGCKVVFIIRNPVETWSSFALGVPKDIHGYLNEIGFTAGAFLKLMFKKYLNEHKNRLATLYRYLLLNYMPKNPNVANSYYLRERFMLLKGLAKDHGVKEPSDWLDVFLIVWTLSNYYGYVNARDSDGLIIYYEEIVENPKFWFEKLRRFGLTVDFKLAEKVTDKYRIKDAKLYYEIEDRIERLRLLNLYNEFKIGWL